jgi:acylphosphatase
MERQSVRFEGGVQGVGFRATARSIASQHKVTGWVRNEADGSVQLEVQGPRLEVQGFLATIRNRLSAFIQRELVETIKPIEGERGFEIRR